LLAHIPETELEKILKQMEFRRFTENTIGSLQEMQTELKRVRKNGFACDLEEHEAHIRCIAAPTGRQGAVNASLSVTGPQQEWQEREFPNRSADTRSGLCISKELDTTHAARAGGEFPRPL
jgi:DNA-binding IclR family transcriptional regulator